MKVAYDLHGVITDNPEQYKSVMETLCKTEGVQVWVISGPKGKDVVKELVSLGLRAGTHYHAVASVVDFLIDSGEEHEQDENGNYWFDEKKWWGAKAAICKEHNIYCLTDDHSEYGEFFTEDHPTKFILKTPESIPTPLNIDMLP